MKPVEPRKRAVDPYDIYAQIWLDSGRRCGMMAAMHDATRATATFLFTDIEGSTQLLKSHRGEYTVLADHHRLLREAFTAHGGREIDNQGDAFFVAFNRAEDAVLAAAACQRALAEHSWPAGGSLKVRMGIHTGEADLAVDRYVGLSVHRAARICAVGHGGQVLVSQTTVSHLEDDEEDLPGIALRDLGERRLKDISRPVRLYQLDIDGLRTRFPPLSISEPPKPNRRKRIGLAAAALLIAGAIATTLALVSRDQPPPKVLPNSLVRIDPNTLKPTEVVPIGDAPDIVVAAGGYLWVTHHVLRDFNSSALRNAGDRTLTRVDPTTGKVVVVGGEHRTLRADSRSLRRRVGGELLRIGFRSKRQRGAHRRVDARVQGDVATSPPARATTGVSHTAAARSGSQHAFGDTSPNSYTLTRDRSTDGCGAVDPTSTTLRLGLRGPTGTETCG